MPGFIDLTIDVCQLTNKAHSPLGIAKIYLETYNPTFLEKMLPIVHPCPYVVSMDLIKLK
jgi:hypothetical protein